MIKYKLILVVFVFVGLFSIRSAVGVAIAQSLSLNPSSAAKSSGVEFAVDLNIDTGGKAVAGTDVKLTYDPAILQVTKIERGDFFSDGVDNKGSGTLYIAGFFPPQFETKTGTGKVVTIYFKGIAEGVSALSFVCTPQTSDTNILDSSANDVIDCAKTNNGSYTITAGSGSVTVQPTVTPRPTSAYGPTAVPPVSGVTLPTVFSFGIGAILTILGIALVF